MVVKSLIGYRRIAGDFGTSLPVAGGTIVTTFISRFLMRQSWTMATGRKPAIVRKLSRDWAAGYAAGEIGRGEAELELLDQAGKVIRVPLDQVKWVCYLRELGASISDPQNPEKLLQKRFRTRPRTAGLWVRLELVDHDVLEGIVANDVSLVRGAGVLLTPPDTRSNTQRIFVPHQAIETLEVVCRIGGAEKRRAVVEADEQPSLFTPPEDETAVEPEPGS